MAENGLHHPRIGSAIREAIAKCVPAAMQG
jgi:hypothetical protein